MSAIANRIAAAAAHVARRHFQTSARRLEAAAPTIGAAAPNATVIPARKPVGAFRGGLFGFFFGSTLAGSAVYYYVLQEYKTSNELLTEDIYALQNAVERLSKYVGTLEEKMETLERQKRK
ncbi:hypothetical protein B0H66DRAFT_32157 [Apodospora peruviana]|uniref:Uncharacterized protein n=1 Tax=Apodospora peruviana TaxID=516989 RepID=A0AAE0IS99_9PEZI|nr:hypothetical protein B0H66DRAFT_32157 [Apodospora peruviana]